MAKATIPIMFKLLFVLFGVLVLFFVGMSHSDASHAAPHVLSQAAHGEMHSKRMHFDSGAPILQQAEPEISASYSRPSQHQRQQQSQQQQQQRRRLIERTANVRSSIPYGMMPTATASVRRAVAGVGGYVAQERSQWSGRLSPSNPGPLGHAQLTLKVPAEKLDATVALVRLVGKVLHFSQSSREVTSSMEAIDVRSSVAKHNINSLLTILRAATKDPAVTDPQLLMLLSELTQHEQELVEQQVAKRRLQNAVDYATIEVALSEAGPERPHQPAVTTADPIATALVVAQCILCILGVLFVVSLVIVVCQHGSSFAGALNRGAAMARLWLETASANSSRSRSPPAPAAAAATTEPEPQSVNPSSH